MMCHRRCRFLYLPAEANSWGCRECHQLTYESRQGHRAASYERVGKPLKVFKRAEAKLAHTRSPERRAVLYQQMREACKTIEESLTPFWERPKLMR